MGLDWIVESKPCDNEAETFYKIKYKLKLLNQNSEENETEISELETELKEISYTPEDTLGDLTEEEVNKLDEIFKGGSFLTSAHDFRGKCIGESELLNEELKEEAYEHHNAEQCIEYAMKLEVFLEGIDKNTLDEEADEISDYEYIEEGIKWLKFWGKSGHGYYAWY
jgi:hypothetical protein